MLGAQLVFKVPAYMFVINILSPGFDFAGQFSSLEWYISFAVWKFLHHYPATSLRVSECEGHFFKQQPLID